MKTLGVLNLAIFKLGNVNFDLIVVLTLPSQAIT